MEALNDYVRPQLHQLDLILKNISLHKQVNFYAHVAKHARRSVNPPIDTWVAFAPNKRGYKMLPHFQIGLFRNQLFIMFGIMHEGRNKEEKVKIFDKHFDKLTSLPSDYSVSLDHMKTEKHYIKDMSNEELHAAIDRVKNVKRRNFLLPEHYHQPIKRLKSDKSFLKFVEETFDEFLKFYQ